MPANWAGFTANTISFLSGQEAADAAESAKFFADEYELATKTAGTVMQNLLTGGVQAVMIENSFKAGFMAMEQLPTAPPLPIFTAMAAGIVGFWATATFNPMPPHPPTIAPAPGVQILVPGMPTPLDAQLMNAFMAGNGIPDPTAGAAAVAAALVSAFSAHMMMISGLYTGLIPAVPSPIPGPPIPWIGIL